MLFYPAPDQPECPTPHSSLACGTLPARGADGLCIRILKLAFSSIGPSLPRQLLHHNQRHPLLLETFPCAPHPQNRRSFKSIQLSPYLDPTSDRQDSRANSPTPTLLLPIIQPPPFPPRSMASAHVILRRPALTFISDHMLSAIESGKNSLLCLDRPQQMI